VGRAPGRGLAAALAVPTSVPERDELIIVTFWARTRLAADYEAKLRRLSARPRLQAQLDAEENRIDPPSTVD
jgi:hypothetical protein